MQTRFKTMVFLAVLALAISPAAAQHHHLGHLAAFHHHVWHHWAVNSMSVYASAGAPYSPYGYPAYSMYGASPYASSAASTLATLTWQQAQAREQELRAGEQELEEAYAAKEEKHRQVHAGRREKQNADRQRRAARRAAQRAALPKPAQPLAATRLFRNGAVALPAPLRGEEFQAGREALEQLIAAGPEDGDFGPGSEFALEVKRLSMAIVAELNTQTRAGEVTCNDFARAKRFVTGMVDDARRPASTDQVASR